MPWGPRNAVRTLLQYLCRYGLPPVWFIIWLISCPFSVNILSHWLHSYIFSPCVNHHIVYKMAISWECSVTQATLMWFILSVYHQKYFMSGTVWKRLVTLTAVIWSLPSMNHQITYKITIILESLVTLATLIWFFSRVIHHMPWKISFF